MSIKKGINEIEGQAHTARLQPGFSKLDAQKEKRRRRSLTWCSRNKPRHGFDASNLREAMMRDMDALEEAMKNSDHPCRKQYSAARRAMQRIDPDKHSQDIINITIRGF